MVSILKCIFIILNPKFLSVNSIDQSYLPRIPSSNILPVLQTYISNTFCMSFYNIISKILFQPCGMPAIIFPSVSYILVNCYIKGTSFKLQHWCPFLICHPLFKLFRIHYFSFYTPISTPFCTYLQSLLNVLIICLHGPSVISDDKDQVQSI